MQRILFENRPIIPTKVICVGRNYRAHIAELGNEVPAAPVLFIKPNSAISDSLYAGDEDEIHYEGEIAFVIEHQQFAGVGFGLDLTKRELQSNLRAAGLPWERAKAFDHAAVFSKFIRVPEALESLSLTLSINDSLVQQGGVQQMIYNPVELFTEIRDIFTLEDGDVIMTGTPAGTGPVARGARFTGRIYAADKLLLEQQWEVI